MFVLISLFVNHRPVPAVQQCKANLDPTRLVLGRQNHPKLATKVFSYLRVG